MKRRIRTCTVSVIFSLGIPIAFALTAFGQEPKAEASPQQVQLGSGMSVIAPGLMEIGSKTRLFLVFADKISLTVEQQKKLEDLYIRMQVYSFQKEADLDVADAEFKSLLTRDTVDLNAVKAKIKEIESIRVEVAMKKIETLLQAISVLSHDQHAQIVLLARDLEETNKPRPPIYQ